MGLVKSRAMYFHYNDPIQAHQGISPRIHDANESVEHCFSQRTYVHISSSSSSFSSIGLTSLQAPFRAIAKVLSTETCRRAATCQQQGPSPKLACRWRFHAQVPKRKCESRALATDPNVHACCYQSAPCLDRGLSRRLTQHLPTAIRWKRSALRPCCIVQYARSSITKPHAGLKIS